MKIQKRDINVRCSKICIFLIPVRSQVSLITYDEQRCNIFHSSYYYSPWSSLVTKLRCHRDCFFVTSLHVMLKWSHFVISMWPSIEGSIVIFALWYVPKWWYSTVKAPWTLLWQFFWGLHFDINFEQRSYHGDLTMELPNSHYMTDTRWLYGKNRMVTRLKITNTVTFQRSRQLTVTWK